MYSKSINSYLSLKMLIFSLVVNIWFSKALVEFFINDRQAAVTSFMRFKESGFDFNAYAYSGEGDKPMNIRKIEIWKMRPTNKGFLKARKNPIWIPKTN